MEGFQRSARCKTMNRDTPWSVSQLLAHLKRAVEVEVGEKSVQGEIGSCKTASSGHIYFTLKDEHAQLACVMYRYQAASCRVMLREGLRVEISGKATSDYITRILSKLILVGALFLGIVALFPIIFAQVTNVGSLALGGTSILIVVSVALETVRQLESLLMMRHHKGFLE